MQYSLLRPAPYYPYMLIRSEDWFKATFLCVPVVKRIVPGTHFPGGMPEIIKCWRVAGPKGTLLQAVPADTPAANEAQMRLLWELREQKKAIQRTCNHAPEPTRDVYWIHDAKFNQELLESPTGHDLAWPSHHSRAYGLRRWHASHPSRRPARLKRQIQEQADERAASS